MCVCSKQSYLALFNECQGCRHRMAIRKGVSLRVTFRLRSDDSVSNRGVLSRTVKHSVRDCMIPGDCLLRFVCLNPLSI